MSAETVEVPRGDCSVCRRSMRLKADGTVRHHGGPRRVNWPYGREYRCDGADLPPKAANPEADR